MIVKIQVIPDDKTIKPIHIEAHVNDKWLESKSFEETYLKKDWNPLCNVWRFIMNEHNRHCEEFEVKEYD